MDRGGRLRPGAIYGVGSDAKFGPFQRSGLEASRKGEKTKGACEREFSRIEGFVDHAKMRASSQTTANDEVSGEQGACDRNEQPETPSVVRNHGRSRCVATRRRREREWF